MRTTRTLCAALALALSAACASAAGPSGSGAPGQGLHEDVEIRVTNRNWSSMTVYAVAGGIRRRIGDVSPMRTATLRVPRAALEPGGTLRLAADPLGDDAIFVTGPIQVRAGQMVQFDVERMLPTSTFAVLNR